MSHDVRLIDANALDRNFYDSCTGECDCCGLHNIVEYGVYGCGLIHLAPTIDAVPVVHAKWETHFFSDSVDTYGNSDFSMKCTACGFLWARKSDTEHFFRYCPSCGAKMDGGAVD